MSGETNYQLRLVASSLSEREAFLRERLGKIPGVAKTQSSFAFRPVVYRTELPST